MLRVFRCMVASRGGYRMARGWHYAKLSLSNAPRLSFSGLCILLFLFLLFVVFCVFVFLLLSLEFFKENTSMENYRSSKKCWKIDYGLTSFQAGIDSIRPRSAHCCNSSNLLTRWDVSSIPVKNKIKMPNEWRTIKSLVHKIRLHGRPRK